MRWTRDGLMGGVMGFRFGNRDVVSSRLWNGGEATVAGLGWVGAHRREKKERTEIEDGDDRYWERGNGADRRVWGWRE